MNPNNSQPYTDAPKAIYQLIQTTLGDTYQYFLGSPIKVAQSAYPIVVVQSISANNTSNGAPTGQDIVSEQINIHILHLENTSAASQTDQDTIMRRLYSTIQGRDTTTGFYLTGTVLYALRTNITLGNKVIDNDIDINYEVTPEADKIIVEAIVQVVVRERVSVQDRL